MIALDRTPVASSDVGLLKLENRQVTGSFKVRGALRKLATLPAGSRVACASAGNHGLGVAWAARALGHTAIVYVPSSVDAAKARGIEALGATLVRTPYPGYDDTAEFALAEAARGGATWVSAFDDPEIRAGNGGSLMAEVLEQVPDVEAIVVPTGGGGMLAGVVQALADRPQVRVYAVQHEGCPALRWSLERGVTVTRTEPFETTAGGLEGGFGEGNFPIVRGRVTTADVSERALHDAMRWLWDAHREIAEPSGAAAIAAVREGRVPTSRRTVVVVSGRNVARATLATILAG